MKLPKEWRDPVKVRVAGDDGAEAWYYVNHGNIDLHLAVPGRPHVTISISRKKLESLFEIKP